MQDGDGGAKLARRHRRRRGWPCGGLPARPTRLREGGTVKTPSRLALHTLVGATAATMVATFALVAPAQAAAPTAVRAPEQDRRSVEEAVELLEPFVHRSEQDGTFVLDAPVPLTREIGSETHQAILGGMDLVNGMVLSGDFVSTPDLRVVPRSSANAGEVTPYHHGVNSWDCGWVSCTIALDRGNTTQLIQLLLDGASVGVVASLLCFLFGGNTCTGLSLAATAILGLGSRVITRCSNAHGVWIRYGLGSWCGGQ